MSSVAFEVRGVSRSYRRRGEEIWANRDIELDIPAGDVFGLLGPNGAGKSTLIRQLVGLLQPDTGAIRLFGEPVRSGPHGVGTCVAYLAQTEPALDELPLVMALATTARLRGVSRRESKQLTAELLDELELTDLAARPLASLSGGQRRLGYVAVALAGERPVLVLDEPTTGLDPVARRAVWDAISVRRKEHGTTVVLVTHNVLEAESVLDRVAILDAGSVIACDTPGRLKASVSDDVRLDIVWRSDPPLDDSAVALLAAHATCEGRRWNARMKEIEARAVLDGLLGGPALRCLDDFTLATPSLEDVYLALGGRSDDLERS